MSLITPNNRRGSKRGRGGGKGGGGGRYAENNRIYAHPLPLIISPPADTVTNTLLGALGLARPRILNPHCTGVFDAATRSVWVTESRDAMLLWQRGFFGKGDLSRSEPSWLARQVSAMRAGARGETTSEQIREKRRAERAQFKLDRARAIAAAAAEAEATFATEGRIIPAEESKASIPSAATWRPSPAGDVPSTAVPTLEKEAHAINDEDLENVEHLQLTLPEAFFLLWTMDCLTVLDPAMNEPMSLPQIWRAFQHAHSPLGFLPSPSPTSIDPSTDLRPDNPFLVNYAVYHHYRALGWVVKGGIKFCVDYMLYKRGPVFHHAEFALVVIPVYEEPTDRDTSPFDLQNVDPFSWSWLSTINRVNSQVHKTLVLAYVTVPACARMSPELLASPACLPHYSVREVILRRFLPARMRD